MHATSCDEVDSSNAFESQSYHDQVLKRIHTCEAPNNDFTSSASASSL